jgi:dTDP-4-dehydrorhamnose 3,5-epimerase
MDEMMGTVPTLIDSMYYKDVRGWFSELYKEEIGDPKLVQWNHSYSKGGVLRGFHYQEDPHAQGKLVTVLHGCIQDIVFSLDKHSKAFAQPLDFTLHTGNKLWVPPGYAHGFLVLTDYAHVLYGCTKPRVQEAERGIIYNDKHVAANWRVPKPLLSAKDACNETLEKMLERTGKNGIHY